MVHTFECLGRYFLLDVESGSVFETDETVFEIIKNKNSPFENASGDFSRFSGEELAEALEEISELERQGILYSPATEKKDKKSDGLIKALCLNISHDCNLRCSYCFADGGAYSGARKNMGEETAIAAVEFLIKNSGSRRNLEIDFFGGEPMLNFGVVKSAIAHARSRESETGKLFRFTLTTNCLLLKDEDIDFINNEIYNVVLSIDGRKNVHNSVRKTEGGKGSFDLVLANALRLKSKRGDKQYYVRGTYTAANTDFSNDVLFLNDCGFDQISVEPVVLDGSDPLALSDRHLPEIFDQYELLAKEYIDRRKGSKWFNFFHFMIDLEGGPCETKRLKGCGAGCEYLAVDPDGKLFPCHQFVGNDAYTVGDVFSGINSKEIPEKFEEADIYSKPDCGACWAKYYCSGGCASNNIRFGGSIDKPFGYSCKIMKKRLECAIAVYCIENSI